MEGQGLGGDEAPIQYSVGMKQDRGTSEHLTQLFKEQRNIEADCYVM